MTAEERQKLYDAIGYEENVASDLPKDVRCLSHCPHNTEPIDRQLIVFHSSILKHVIL